MLQMRYREYIPVARQELTGKDGGPVEHVGLTMTEWRKQRDERRKQAADAAAMTGDE
jgi:hypothetical protein